MNCPVCKVEVEEVGITVTVRETRLYMRESFGKALVMTGTLGRPELEAVRCRNCLSILPVKAVETLKVGE
jgi:hypothetical protein